MTMKQLQAKGVSAILDYAAEADIAASPPPSGDAKAAPPSREVGPPVKDNKEAVARVYDYESEQQCDRCGDVNVDTPTPLLEIMILLVPRGRHPIPFVLLGTSRRSSTRWTLPLGCRARASQP